MCPVMARTPIMRMSVRVGVNAIPFWLDITYPPPPRHALWYPLTGYLMETDDVGGVDKILASDEGIKWQSPVF